MNRQIVAFGIVAFVLVVGSDLDATAPISVAFAYLILLSATIAVGPVAFERISELVGGKPAQGTGGGGVVVPHQAAL